MVEDGERPVIARTLLFDDGLEKLDRRTEGNDVDDVAILNRGYALVFDANGGLVKEASQVKVGDEISARLARGGLNARVTSTEQVAPESGTSH